MDFIATLEQMPYVVGITADVVLFIITLIVLIAGVGFFSFFFALVVEDRKNIILNTLRELEVPSIDELKKRCAKLHYLLQRARRRYNLLIFMQFLKKKRLQRSEGPKILLGYIGHGVARLFFGASFALIVVVIVGLPTLEYYFLKNVGITPLSSRIEREQNWVKSYKEKHGYIVYAHEGQDIIFTNHRGKLDRVTLTQAPIRYFVRDIDTVVRVSQEYSVIKGNDLRRPIIATYRINQAY